MRIAMPCACSIPVKAMEVNWLPWSALKISGLPRRAKASRNASRQNSVPSVIESRHARTRRLNHPLHPPPKKRIFPPIHTI